MFTSSHQVPGTGMTVKQLTMLRGVPMYWGPVPPHTHMACVKALVRKGKIEISYDSQDRMHWRKVQLELFNRSGIVEPMPSSFLDIDELD